MRSPSGGEHSASLGAAEASAVATVQSVVSRAAAVVQQYGATGGAAAHALASLALNGIVDPFLEQAGGGGMMALEAHALATGVSIVLPAV